MYQTIIEWEWCQCKVLSKVVCLSSIILGERGKSTEILWYIGFTVFGVYRPYLFLNCNVGYKLVIKLKANKMCILSFKVWFIKKDNDFFNLNYIFTYCMEDLGSTCQRVSVIKSSSEKEIQPLRRKEKGVFDNRYYTMLI